MAYLIKNAHLYNPDDMGVQDVLVVNDKVAAIGKDLTVVLPDLEMVDAKGMIMTPGFIDQHIHVTGGGGEGGPKSHRKSYCLNSLNAVQPVLSEFPERTAFPVPFPIFWQKSRPLLTKGFLLGCTQVTMPIRRQRLQEA